MKNLPEQIYLNFGPIDEDEDFVALREVTWCTDKINETDAEYLSLDFVKWYSGMEEEKILKALEQFKKEKL